jgi:hypothetical protein
VRMLDPATPVVEKTRLKQPLLEYCTQDTLALAKLLEVLRKRV